MNIPGKLFSTLVLCVVAGVAAADGDGGDSSMNPYTGESWAALQGGGHHPGEYKPKVTVRFSKRETRRPWIAPDRSEGTQVARDGRLESPVNASRDGSAT